MVLTYGTYLPIEEGGQRGLRLSYQSPRTNEEVVVSYFKGDELVITAGPATGRYRKVNE